MATVLKTLTQFVAVAAGATQTVAHGLLVEDGARIPDLCFATNGAFQITLVTTTQITVRNNGQIADDCYVYSEIWHSQEKALVGGADALAVRPIIPSSEGLGGTAAEFMGLFGNGNLGDVVLGVDHVIAGDECYDSLDTGGFNFEFNVQGRLFVRNRLTIRAGSSLFLAPAGGGVDMILPGQLTGGAGGAVGAGAPGTNSTFALGGAGGAGGAGAGGAGGAAGTAAAFTQETRPDQLPEAITMRGTGRNLGPGYAYYHSGAGGGGGGGDGVANNGGAGGDGGGTIVIVAREIVIEAGAFIQANGEDGAVGTAADCGGGGGGGGGTISLVYRRLTNAGTIRALGGAGGASGGGVGVAGNAGAAGVIYQLAV